MTQAQWAVLVLKAGLIGGFVSIAAWVVVYSRLAKWWRNPVGRTMVIEAALIGVLLIPSAMSLFLNFNRLTSEIAGWVDAGLIALITPVMLGRVVLWLRLHRHGGGMDGGGE